ncbi:helix-turn-helix domain-containing protein [Streptomyces sp. NBC_01298]|uniref:helix-turn-helix domain-containing protein n=1 Tax=Streptomyces sp. NBC_01298 TaxID=2903817 RepID=UPI002E13D38D|nr:helix-turn-helix domain-containing protein [Streptomyces sp. NBC_01298]
MTLPAECGHLAAELRQLRRRTGLSLADLGRSTPFSKSSWERYLNGKQPPPRQAVEALCALARRQPGELLALWELADSAWSGRAVPTSPASPASSTSSTSPTSPVGPRPVPGGRRRRTVLAASAVGGITLIVTASLLLPRGSGPRHSDGAGTTEKPIRNPGCSAASCTGKDPVRMGCGGAGMVTDLRTDTGPGSRQLELRYGALCRAVWVRTSGLQPGDHVELFVAGVPDPQELWVSEADLGRYAATPMAAVPQGTAGTRSCVTPGNPADGARVCFG